MKGIYLLANDTVLDQLKTCVNSIKCHNPLIHICVIPFNDNWQLCKQFCHDNTIITFQDSEIISKCEYIAEKIHRCSHKSYFRKLCCFNGPFSEFIYLDVDIVIGQNIEFMFNQWHLGDLIVGASNHIAMFKDVWSSSIYDNKGLLTKEQIEFSANTGIIVSKKNPSFIQHCLDSCTDFLSIVVHTNLNDNADQPPFNFFIITYDWVYTSFNKLRCSNQENFPIEVWAGTPNNLIINEQHQITLNEIPVYAIHWAGISMDKLTPQTYDWIWNHFKQLNVTV